MLETGLALSLSPLRRVVLLLALVFAPCASWPAAPAPAASATTASHADERARIARERSAVEARFRSREDECRQRFIVTSCLDDAKAERRQAIDKLRARKMVVDEARRHERADERRAELADKAAEDARRESERAAHAAASAGSEPAARSGRPFESPRPRVATSAASGGHDRPGPARIGPEGKPRPEESKASRQQREAASRAAFEARKAQAIEHRNEVIDRTTKRMSQKSPAAPLPVPPAPAASRAAVRP
jgi:hypothetical protein